MYSIRFGTDLRKDAKQHSEIATMYTVYNGFVPQEGMKYKNRKETPHAHFR